MTKKERELNGATVSFQSESRHIHLSSIRTRFYIQVIQLSIIHSISDSTYFLSIYMRGSVQAFRNVTP